MVKLMNKQCSNTNSDTDLALLKVTTMSLGPGLPSLVTLLFNNPIRAMLPIANRLLLSIDNDDEHQALVERQKMKEIMILQRNYSLLSIVATTAVQWEDSDIWTHGKIFGKDHNMCD